MVSTNLKYDLGKSALGLKRYRNDQPEINLIEAQFVCVTGLISLIQVLILFQCVVALYLLYIFLLEMSSTSMFDISISLVIGLIKIETKFSPLSPSLIAITKMKYNSHQVPILCIWLTPLHSYTLIRQMKGCNSEHKSHGLQLEKFLDRSWKTRL